MKSTLAAVRFALHDFRAKPERAPGASPAWPVAGAAPGCVPVVARGRLLIVLSGLRRS